MKELTPKVIIKNLDKNKNPKRICENGISDICKKRKLTIPYSDKAMLSVTRSGVWCCVECFELKLKKKIPKEDWKGKIEI